MIRFSKLHEENLGNGPVRSCKPIFYGDPVWSGPVWKISAQSVPTPHPAGALIESDNSN